MADQPTNVGSGASRTTDAPGRPLVVDRASFQAELDTLRVREKTHTHESDAIAAARRRLPMVEVDVSTTLIGPNGPVNLLDTFEGRRQLIAYYFMWNSGHPAAEQCEGCTWVTTQVAEMSYLHSRDITFAVFCRGPYKESAGYHDFMDWRMPWYSAQHSLGVLLAPPETARHDAPCVLPARRRARLRNLLDDHPRRRGNGQQLLAYGPHRVRTPGTVGGLAPRLAPTVATRRGRRYQEFRRSGQCASAAVPRPDHAPSPDGSRLESGRSEDLDTA